MKKRTHPEFLLLCERLFGLSTTDYSLDTYKGSNEYYLFRCKKHNKEYSQRPCKHLESGNGCVLCQHEKIRKTLLSSNETFIENANKKHGVGRYDYSKVNRQRSHDNQELGCNTCNYWFFQEVSNHLKGHGCPRCGHVAACLKSHKLSYDVEGTLYLIEIRDNKGNVCYKVGVSTDISNRFTGHLSKYEINILDSHKGKIGDMLYVEHELLTEVNDYDNYPLWLPSYFSGKYECFVCSKEEALSIWNSVVDG